MAQQNIGLGAVANDGTGDDYRTAFTKTQDNFDELFPDVAALKQPTKQLVINAMSEFPAPVAGVRTLAASTFYLIGTNLTTSDRFVLSQDTVVAGLDSSTSSITFTGGGTMFTATNTSNKITLLTLDCPSGTLHNITATTPGSVFQFVNCTVDSCDVVGTLDGLTAIQYSDVAFNDIKTDGITFIGNISIFIGNTDVVTVNGATAIFLDLGTAVFDAFSLDASFATLVAGSIFLSGATGSANISANNSGTITNIKTFGTGTPLSGITIDDIRWFFSGNDSISDTAPDALANFKGNATATTITATSSDGTNAVLVAGTWTCQRQSHFSCTTAGRITYTGERDLITPIDIIATLDPAADHTLAMYLALNGTPISSTGLGQFVKSTDPETMSTMWQLNLKTNDFLEVFVENQTGTSDITVVDIIFRVR